MTAFEQRDYRHMTTRRPCPPPSPAAGLAAQHPKLLPQDEDLQVLGAVVSVWEAQQTGELAGGQPEHKEHRRMVRNACSRREPGFPRPTGVATDDPHRVGCLEDPLQGPVDLPGKVSLWLRV